MKYERIFNSRGSGSSGTLKLKKIKKFKIEMLGMKTNNVTEKFYGEPNKEIQPCRGNK